jgi:hypothetical protein
MRDNRLGGVPHLIFHPFGEPLVQIPPEILKCVAFLYSRDRDGIPAAIGTCFFVGYEYTAFPGTYLIYAVTAGHVIRNADIDGNDGHSHFRFNLVGGGCGWAEMPFSLWTFSDDRSVDLAIAPIAPDFAVIDHKQVPSKMFLNDSVINQYHIGPGEELFFPGLFVEHQGEERNAPIVRIGNIAAMPGEHVMAAGDIRSRVYLAEARSIGGLSGSPVFVDVCGQRIYPNASVIDATSKFYFLGVVKGHFDEETKSPFADDIHLPSRVVEKVNMGIALVVPASDLAALLEQQDVVEKRAAIEAMKQKAIDEERRNFPVDD